MSHLVVSNDLTQLLSDTLEYHMSLPHPDAVLSIETHLFDVQLIAQSMAFEFDVGKQLHLNVGRWSRLIKEYVPKTPFEHFVTSCREIVAGQARDGACAGFLFRDPPRHAKKHRWGGCLQSMNFRSNGKGKGFTLTVNSRTTYLGYMGHMDACLFYTMASYIGDPSQITLVWNIASMQLHCFKSLPLLFTIHAVELKLYDFEGQDFPAEKLRKEVTPTWYYIFKWYERILRDFKTHGVKMIEVEKYGPFKRVKRRWLEHRGFLKKNIPPSLPVDMLTFDKAIDGDGFVDGGLADDEDDESFE